MNRKTGRTWAMLAGVIEWLKSTPVEQCATLVVAEARTIQRLVPEIDRLLEVYGAREHRTRINFTTLAQINHGATCGSRDLVVYDHRVTEFLFRDNRMLRELVYLQQQELFASKPEAKECTPEDPCLDFEHCPNCATFPSGSGG